LNNEPKRSRSDSGKNRLFLPGTTSRQCKSKNISNFRLDKISFLQPAFEQEKEERIKLDRKEKGEGQNFP